jgi:hypothetical protein
MKIRLLILGTLGLFWSQIAMAESCYLLIEKTGKFEPMLLFEVTSTLLAQFVEPVQEFPPGGVSSKDCLYRLSVFEDPTTLSISIAGRKVAGLGNSDQKGIKGLQQSILRALWGANSEIQNKVCVGYQSILTQECGDLSASTKEEAYEEEEEEEESDSIGEFWFAADEQEEYAIYLNFKGSKRIKVCEMDGENYYFEELRIRNQMIEWGEEQYEVYIEEDILLLEGQNPQEFDLIDTTSEICAFYFSSEVPSKLKISELSGIWYVEFEEEEDEEDEVVEAIYVNIDEEGNAEICEIKKGEVDGQHSGVFKNSTFTGEDDEPVPAALISGILLIKGDDYVDMFTRTDKAPDDCWD